GCEFAEHPAGVKLAVLLDHELEVAEEEVDLFGRRGGEGRNVVRRARELTPPARLGSLQTAEDPPVDECAAADPDGGTAREFSHSPGVGNRSHVAVSYDRNLFDRFDDGANSFQINRAAESLRARPAVDGDRGDAKLLELPRQDRRGDPLTVPPQPHL